MTMMLWALILAITIYPLHQMLAARIGGKQGLASELRGQYPELLIPTADGKEASKRVRQAAARIHCTVPGTPRVNSGSFVRQAVQAA